MGAGGAVQILVGRGFDAGHCNHDEADRTPPLERSPPSATLTKSSGFGAKKEKPVGNRPGRLTVERGMRKHLKLLPRILVKIGIKVKITIVRK
jgi:hypothetical protein